MIDSKLSSLDPIFLNIVKPSGKSISLLIGEIVKAKIIDILPSGEVNLRIKGELLKAMTNISLKKGEFAFFKVADLTPDKNHLRLQFIEYVNKTPTKEKMAILDLKDSQLPKLLKQYTNLIHTSQNTKNLNNITKLQTLHLEILKSLPSDANLLPKEVRLSLSRVLQEGQKLSNKGIHVRLNELINQVPEELKEHPVVAGIKKDLLVSIDRILHVPLKHVIQNTGILLEPKLMAIARLFFQIKGFDNLDYLMENNNPTVISKNNELKDAQHNLLLQNMSSLKQDLKAKLLQLRQLLIDDVKVQKSEIFNYKELKTQLSRTNAELLSKISGLIHDIETFQMLSKITDSFYTFLPLIWQDLKDCNLSIRRGKLDGQGESYSCRINLDLERLGKLSAVIMMLNKEFIIFFKADNPEFQTILDKNIEELYKSFRESKLNLKTVNFLKTKETIEQIEGLEVHKGISTKV